MKRQPAYAVIPYLRDLPLFSDMPACELERLSEDCIVRQASRGELLFQAGDPCDELHAVISGQVKLFVLAANGQEKVLDLIRPGQAFAEALMFSNLPYLVNAQALVDTTLLTVGRSAIMRELDANHRFALRMLSGISDSLNRLTHDVECYTLHSGMQRVIEYLLSDDTPALPCSFEQAPRQRTITLPVSKATLASRLSVTPEYFSNVLHELIEHGLIEVDKRHIHICDTEQLSQYTVSHARRVTQTPHCA